MKHAARHMARWGLTLHIYLSMAGFLLVLLFAVTGLTLNHEDFGWSQPRITHSTITLPLDLLRQPDERAVGDQLRSMLHMPTPVTHFSVDDDQIDVMMTAPGRHTQVTISRRDGRAEVEAETRGALATLDDLHKGLDSGPLWRWIIDITAVLLTISSLTGIVTLLTLPRRRKIGLVVGLLGAVVITVLYLVWVPR
jgi:hypothetical protein